MKNLPLLILAAAVAVISCSKDPNGSKSPKVSSYTGEATSVTYNSATLSGRAMIEGEVPSDTNYGVLVSSNSVIEYDAADVMKLVANDSDPDLNYSVVVNGLEDDKTYYFCSYLYYKETVYYGEVKSFTTELKITDLSAKVSANCYIVNAEGKYMFKATVKGNSTESVGAPASAEVIWESYGTLEAIEKGAIINNSVSLKDGYVYFSTPEKLNDGNALIAVKDASDNILWSWHIWVCRNYAPTKENQQVYNNSAGVMMDRNLGATSATKGEARALGLLYQWGRKDPFLGSGAIDKSTQAESTISWPDAELASNHLSDNNTLSYATSHPTTFLKTHLYRDWYCTGESNRNDNLWSSSKTMYDPCPPGWRVPDGGKEGVWCKALGISSNISISGIQFDSTNNGMDFGSNGGQSASNQFGAAATIWYPLAGYRADNNGQITYVSLLSDYWSCTPYEKYSNALSLNKSGAASPAVFPVRGTGASVRCIAE